MAGAINLLLTIKLLDLWKIYAIPVNFRPQTEVATDLFLPVSV